MGVKWDRHSNRIIKTKRWKSVRYLAKKRDGFKCVQCGAVGRLEVDHIKPVRLAPELAYDLNNLQTLCPSCHSKKTIIEIGLSREATPDQKAWQSAVQALYKK